MESIWHIGFAVPGLVEGKKELSDVFGLSWRPTRVRTLTLVGAYGRPYDVECHVAFSCGGPFAVEVWRAIPGAPLDIPKPGGVHHIGYWVDDITAEANRLGALGYPCFATAGHAPLFNWGPAGTLVELCPRPARHVRASDQPVPSSASELQPELNRSFRLAHAHRARRGVG